MFIARKGDTTTLGAKGPVKLKPLKNPRGAAPSTLTPKVCPMNPHAAGVSNPLFII